MRNNETFFTRKNQKTKLVQNKMPQQKKSNFKEITMRTLFLMIALMMIFLSSCRDNPVEIIIPEKTEYWNHFYFNSTWFNMIMNGIATEDKFYALIHVGILGYENFVDTPPLRTTGGNISIGFNTRTAMSKEFTAYFPQNRLDILRFAHNYNDQVSEAFITPKDFGVEFEDFVFWSGTTFGNLDGRFGVFNNQNRFIALLTSQPFYFHHCYVVYMDIVTEGGQIVIKDKGFWKLPNEGNSVSYVILDIMNFKDNFYITWYESRSHYVRISSDGIEKHGNVMGMQIRAFFEFQGYLFAHRNIGDLYYTSDEETWYRVGWTIPTMKNSLEINDYLFTYLYDTVYFFDDVFGAFTLYRLPIENLQGRHITSMDRFKDDLVITTTAGLFHKPIEEVLNDRILVSSTRQYNLLGE
ncbi:MAG: hypothetical protein FWG98_09610 [Candidatus Cloacimonetes bacterium]|nr:hypothetical protein [Candidatus Cloacimonadota bacterium]